MPFSLGLQAAILLAARVVTVGGAGPSVKLNLAGALNAEPTVLLSTAWQAPALANCTFVIDLSRWDLVLSLIVVNMVFTR